MRSEPRGGGLLLVPEFCVVLETASSRVPDFVPEVTSGATKFGGARKRRAVTRRAESAHQEKWRNRGTSVVPPVRADP